MQNELVVEPTHLKNISRIGSFLQVGVNIKHVWNHHLEKGATLITWSWFYLPKKHTNKKPRRFPKNSAGLKTSKDNNEKQITNPSPCSGDFFVRHLTTN